MNTRLAKYDKIKSLARENAEKFFVKNKSKLIDETMEAFINSINNNIANSFLWLIT